MADVTQPLISSPTDKNVQEGEDSVDEFKSSLRVPSYKAIAFKVYPWRWFMLLSLCVLNVSNGMMWLTFAPIPDYTSKYYNISLSKVDWFSLVYFTVSLVMGFISIYILNKFSLKVSIYAGGIFNAIGGLLRVISTLNPVICSSVFMNAGFVVALLGQTLTACAQPFLLYAPTTLASVWFGPNERAVATGLTSLANPIGLAVVQVASPYIVTTVSKLQLLLIIYAIPAAIGLVMILIAFWYKEPPTPPTPSGKRDHIPSFFQGLRQIMKLPSFLLLLVVWGGGAGLFNAFLTILPQILCPYGYSDKEIGLWGSLMIFCGMVGALFAGLILDYTKFFKGVAVTTYALAILSFIWFYEVFSLSEHAVLIAFSLIAFGFFGLPLIPACMELGVEITYPVSEVTSSGLLWSSAQVMGIIIVIIGEKLAQPLSPDQFENKCSSSLPTNDTSVPTCFHSSQNSSILTDETALSDQNHTIMFCIGITIVNFIILVACFWPKYRRVESEKRCTFEKSVVVK